MNRAILTKAAIFLIALVTLISSTAQAVIIPIGNHSFSGNIGTVNILESNGANFVTPGPIPFATLSVQVDGNPLLTQLYPNSQFVITSGFAETSTRVTDENLSSTVDAGDSVRTNIGPGTFEIQDSFGTIIYGSFNGGKFDSLVGSTSGAGFSADVLGLNLTPGPAFNFDTTSVSAIDDPEGFGFSLSFITGGVNVSGAVPIPFTDLFTANLDPFGSSDGSVTVSGQITVVPEPSSVMFGLMGIIGLVIGIAILGKRSSR